MAAGIKNQFLFRLITDNNKIKGFLPTKRIKIRECSEGKHEQISLVYFGVKMGWFSEVKEKRFRQVVSVK